MPSVVICFCKECGRDLFERDARLRPGDPIEASSFRALPGVRQPHSGDESRCPFCGVSFAWWAGDGCALGFRDAA